MSTDRFHTPSFHTQGYFELEGPAEPSFLSRVLQVLQLRGCIVESFACARRGDGFSLSVVIAEADRCRPDVIAALMRKLIGVSSLRWHLEGRRAEADAEREVRKLA